MGDPKKLRKKYETPAHPWEKERIAEEKELKKKYGFRNKKEIWKTTSLLRQYKAEAKRLITLRTAQAEKERQQLLQRLVKLAILKQEASLDNVLALTLENVLERRLQSIVFRKELARSMNQARQFIVHRHIVINDKKITSPGYLVSQEEETQVGFHQHSKIADDLHPERTKEKPVIKDKKETKTDTKKEKKSIDKASKELADEKKTELVAEVVKETKKETTIQEPTPIKEPEEAEKSSEEQ